MQVFKTSLKIVLRSPTYLLLYIVFFGLLGLVLATSVANTQPPMLNEASRVDVRPKVAVIDRDESVVSVAFTEFLAERSTFIVLEDSTKALQDATAQNTAGYIVIIPQGFGERFLDAAKGSTALPQLETVVNYVEAEALLMDLVVNRYLQALHMTAALSPQSSVQEILAQAASAASLQSEVQTAKLIENPSITRASVFYYLWISYPLSLGLIVLSGMIFSTFRQGELRRRNLCAPLSSSKMNMQVALGGASLIFLTWAFMMALSLLPMVGGLEILTANPLAFVLLALAVLIYALVPFSIGFLLSQFGLKEAALNGAANILSLGFSFLSGIFMGGAAFLGETMQAVARVIPAYWYNEAIASLTEGSLSSGTGVLSTYFSSLGIVALFAIAFFSIALLAGKRGSRSAEGGGNPAAEARV